MIEELILFIQCTNAIPVEKMLSIIDSGLNYTISYVKMTKYHPCRIQLSFFILLCYNNSTIIQKLDNPTRNVEDPLAGVGSREVQRTSKNRMYNIENVMISRALIFEWTVKDSKSISIFLLQFWICKLKLKSSLIY